jgi:hypothetical protein
VIIAALVDTGSTHNLVEYNFAKRSIPDFATRFFAVDMPPLTLGDDSSSMIP